MATASFRYRLALVASPVIATLLAHPLSADDFVVSTSTTATNGGAVINGTDTLTINTGATIDHTGQAVGPAVSTTGGGNDVVNNGTIIGDGTSDARGVVLNEASSSFTNTGTVRTTANNGHTVEALSNGATITNSGTFSTIGDNAHALYFSGQSAGEGTNSGTIIATGAGSDAVHFNGSNATYTSSGATISRQGAAIYFGGAENGLTLNAPAYVEGTIILGGSTGVAINTGRSHSFQWTFGGAQWFSMNISGSVPYVISGTTVASIDPTGFDAAPTGMLETSTQVFGAIGDRAAHLLPKLNIGPSVSTKLGTPIMEPPVTKARSFRRWATVLGSAGWHAPSGVKLGYQTAQAGVVAGLDWATDRDRVFGLMAGGALGRFAANATFMQSYRIQSNTGFIGLYGARRFGKAVFDYSLMGGLQTHNSQRAVNNNLLPGGIDTGIATYGSTFIAPQMSLGRAFALGSDLTLTTSATLGYMAGFVDGYTETGVATTATFASRRFGIGTGSAKLDLAKSFGATTVSGQIGLIAQNGFGGETLAGTLLGQNWAYTTASGASLAGHMAVELKRQFTSGMFGKLGAEANIGSTGFANLKGSASLRLEF